MTLYIAYNGAMPTSAATAPVATSAVIKTLLQIATPATQGLRVVEWGISFDGTFAATPVRCELIQTDTAATVTAHVAAGVQPYHNPAAPASFMTLGTTATGYSASGEGSAPTATRWFDTQLVAPTNQYVKQWPLGREPVMGISKFLRVRVTAAATVNAYCYVIWDENQD